MPSPATPKVNAFDFPGIIANLDDRDLPDGAAELQVNMCSYELGLMITRGGLQPVVFDSE